MDWKRAKPSPNVQTQKQLHPARPKGDPLAPRPGFFFTDIPRYRVARGDKATAGAFAGAAAPNPNIIHVVEALRRKD